MDASKYAPAGSAAPVPDGKAGMVAPGAYSMLDTPSGAVTSEPYRAMKQDFQNRIGELSAPLMTPLGMAAPNDVQVKQQKRYGY